MVAWKGPETATEVRSLSSRVFPEYESLEQQRLRGWDIQLTPIPPGRQADRGTRQQLQFDLEAISKAAATITADPVMDGGT
jgi:hypothetical protein